MRKPKTPMFVGHGRSGRPYVEAKFTLPVQIAALERMLGL